MSARPHSRELGFLAATDGNPGTVYKLAQGRVPEIRRGRGVARPKKPVCHSWEREASAIGVEGERTKGKGKIAPIMDEKEKL